MTEHGFTRAGRMYKDLDGKVVVEVNASTAPGIYAFVTHDGTTGKVGLGAGGAGVLGRLGTYAAWLNKEPRDTRNEQILHPLFHAALDVGEVAVWVQYTDDARGLEKSTTAAIGPMPWVLR